MTPFGYWRPDQADTSDPTILQSAINVRPKPGGYGPVPSLLVASGAEALAATPRGGFSGVTSTGIYQAFVGTATTIEKLAADFTWDTVGTPYTIAAGDNWSFTGLGKYVIATNRADGMQQYDLDLGGSFALITGAPIARITFVAFGCLFAGDCDGNNRVLKNTDYYQTTDWTGGVKQRTEFQEGGEILGGGQIDDGHALVFQRQAVRLLTFIGGSVLYRQDSLALEQGAVNPDCIVFVGRYAYYIDTDGFYRASGAGVEPIGQNKVDETFLARLAAAGLDSVQGAYDAARSRIVWRYQRSDVGSTTVFEDGIALDLHSMEFTELEETTTLIIAMATPGYSLDAMGTSFGSMDSITTIPLDSRYWFGGEPRLGALNSDFKFGFYDGPSLAATIETSTLANDNSALVTRMRVKSDADAGTVQLGYSDDLEDSLTFISAVSKTRGTYPVRARGFNFRVRYNIPAADAWTFANGVSDITQASGGAF